MDIKASFYGVAILVAALVIYLYLRSRDMLFLYILGSIIFFLIGGVRMHVALMGDHALDPYVGEKVELSGFVCAEPQQKDITQNICFKSEAEDRMLITSQKYPAYSYGEEIFVSGILMLPKNFETYPGGPEFDYVSYLAKDGIRYVMMRPQIESRGMDGGNFIIRALLSIKSAFVRRIELLYSEPESSLLGGILLGDRQSISKDITEEFKSAGLIHILVLSGYNVTIVAESLMRAFSFLPTVFGRSFGAISIVLFALMTGASATTVRASIMALIVILSKSVSRRYDAARALTLAAFCMVLENPRILVFDVSFELSFLATLALIYVSPLVTERLGFVTERWNFREVLSTTIATQVFVAPFLLYSMGQLSVISLISNLFVLPAIPSVMMLGFVSVSLSFVSTFIAMLPAWTTTFILTYVLEAASFFGNMPFAAIQIKASAFTLAFIYILYAILLIFAWRRRNYSPHSPN